MDIKEAKKIIEDYGWEIQEGKYWLKDSDGYECSFDTDESLISYAEDLKIELANRGD